MRVLVIGGGGREHALVARLASEGGITELVCAPGNPGIARQARTVPLAAATEADVEALLALADHERVDLTVVGPELPLSLGIADRFAVRRCPLLGPTAAAARLETSKAFAKAFMARHHVPTARFETSDTVAHALDVVRSAALGFPVVL